MVPFIGGGDMIKEVTFEKTTYNVPPFMFEAGTPNIAGVIGLSAALNFVSKIGINKIEALEKELLLYATQKLSSIEGLKIIGDSTSKTSVISFNLNNIHHFDLGTLLDQLGIAIRTGHHCTQPLMNFFDISGTARVSFAFYNTKQEVDYFVKSLKKAIAMLI